MRQAHHPGDRFIPACAGNACQASHPTMLRTVHPRVCGERLPVSPIIVGIVGSSPRVRGTHLLEQAIPKLADTLDFRAFATHAFAWLDGMQENAPDTGDDFTEYPDEKATWNELISEISAQYGADQVTLHLLLQELDMRSKAPKPPTGAVPCFTIHASKLDFADFMPHSRAPP